jgi:hypothetical protein
LGHFLDNFTKPAIDLLRGYWLTISALFICILISLLSSLLFISKIGESKDSKIAICIYIIASLTPVLIWVYNRYLKIRVKKNEIGLLISLSTDSFIHRKKIQRLFVESFEKEMFSTSTPKKFKVVFLSEYFAKRLITEEDATTFLDKSNATFLLRGRALEGREDGKMTNLIELIGWRVKHAPIPEDISVKLANEMGQVTINKWILPFENELEGFIITSALVSSITKYIIGISLSLSLDFLNSEKVLEKLFLEITRANYENKIEDKVIRPFISRFKEQILKRLLLIYFAELDAQHIKWWAERHDVSHYLRIRDILHKVSTNPTKLDNNQQFSISTMKSLCYFILDRNIDTAIEENKKWMGRTEGSWRYSLGFLYAYKGNTQKASREYEEAFRTATNETVVIQCEEFINWVLTEEPDKVQLYFYLANINLKAKNDKIVCREYLEEFLSKPGSENFPDLMLDAKNIIKTMANQNEHI